MSPSWTSRLLITPPVLAGIAIGQSRVCAAVLDASSGSRKVIAMQTHEIASPLFSGQVTAEAEDNLTSALTAISDAFRETFASVHVALPDMVLRSTVFELDELPKAENMRNALLRWRFSQEWARHEDSLDCRGCDLGENHGKRIFFGQAGDRSWLECVRHALFRAGIIPWSLNAAAVYRFNHFYDVIAGKEGALLSLDPDCWNLLIWDGSGRVRHALTRLRQDTIEGEITLVVDEAERAILAYLQGGANRGISKLHLTGSEADICSLAEMFDGRLSERAVMLAADDGVFEKVPGMRTGLAPLALAAAQSS